MSDIPETDEKFIRWEALRVRANEIGVRAALDEAVRESERAVVVTQPSKDLECWRGEGWADSVLANMAAAKPVDAPLPARGSLWTSRRSGRRGSVHSMILGKIRVQWSEHHFSDYSVEDFNLLFLPV